MTRAVTCRANASRLFEAIQFVLPSTTFSLASRIIRPLGDQNPNLRLHLSRSRRKLSAMAVRVSEEQGDAHADRAHRTQRELRQSM
jgi:hypothetical protein